jgi:hypothetical protein
MDYRDLSNHQKPPSACKQHGCSDLFGCDGVEVLLGSFSWAPSMMIWNGGSVAHYCSKPPWRVLTADRGRLGRKSNCPAQRASAPGACLREAIVLLYLARLN